MENIVNQFDVSSKIARIVPLKIGHINDSFIVECEGDEKQLFFLQKINHHIFKDVEGLQRNIVLVTDHLRKKLIERNESDLERKVLRLVLAKNGNSFIEDESGGFWRMYFFVKDTRSYDSITPELAYKAGKAFGEFQSLLSDIDTTKLIETIPDFHNIEFRLEQFREAVRNDVAGRLLKNKNMVDEIEARAEEMCLPERLFREGKLPKRINHCDTKVNNLLFDTNDNPICIVDLDTVMPGFVLSDFGDFIRTGANRGAEDDPVLENIGVDLDIFEAYTRGYLEEAKFLLPIELENLAFGAKMLTYMQTVRFFTDYLNGDTYYKIESKEHNKQRALAQFQLLKNQEKNFFLMQKIVRESAK